MATEREVRDWLAGRLGQRVKGRLSKGMINGWNRTHPDDPFVDTRTPFTTHPARWQREKYGVEEWDDLPTRLTDEDRTLIDNLTGPPPEPADRMAHGPDRERRECPMCGRSPIITATGALHGHNDRRGFPCPGSGSGGRIPDDALELAAREVPQRVGNALPTTGHCHECGAFVSGERRYCGPCLAGHRV